MATKRVAPKKKVVAKKKAASRPKAGTSSVQERKKIFVEVYLANGGNATDAAIQAGYSKKTAKEQGSRLLADVNVKAQVSKRAEIVANKYELSAELAAKSIYQELTFDPAELYNDDGSLKSVKDLDKDIRMALTSVEFEEIGGKGSPITVRKVKWASRNQAREQLMKHLGMFEKDNKQKSPLDGVSRDLLIAIAERLNKK